MSVQRDIDDELRFHLEARVEELVTQGMARDAARAQALSEFGDVNETRASLAEIDTRVAKRRNRLEWVGALLQDLKYTIRSLRRSPIVSLTIIITLALGLGANAAMFSLLDVIYFRPPAGVAHPNALRRVWVDRGFVDGRQFWSGYDYNTYSNVVRALGADAEATTYRPPAQRTIGVGEDAPKVRLSGTSGNFFGVLGVKPARGRVYGPDEAIPGESQPVIVLSDAFWRRHFHADENILGKEIVIGVTRFTIVGITPPGFTGVDLDVAEAWVPLEMVVSTGRPRPWWTDINSNGFQIVVRLNAGANEAPITERLTQVMRSPELGLRADTLAVAQLGAINVARGPGRQTGEMQVATRLAGVAVIVLLIACANVVNLLLARAATRQREMAVRVALGISRARLLRLLITESLVLALVAGMAAVVAAQWGTRLIRGLLLPTVEWGAVGLHWRLLLFALGVTLLTGVVTGLVPAWRASSPVVVEGLRAGTRSRGTHRARLRTFLVVAQAALSVVLLVGAALFIRSLENVTALDVGFAVRRFAMGAATYPTRDSIRDAAFPARLRAIEARARAIPGVEHVAFTSDHPLGGFSTTNAFFVDADTARYKLPYLYVTGVTPDYFAAVGARLIAGNTITQRRSAADPQTVVINQAMATILWPGQNPIGRCIRWKQGDPCATIVGVVQTALFNHIDEDPSPHLYISLDYPTTGLGGPEIVVSAQPERIAGVSLALHDLLRSEFPGATPWVKTMSDVMAPQYRPWTLGSRLFAAFGVLALLVAAVGVYSAVSYAVTQRTHEFGVRMALGARGSDVLGQVLREEARTVALGVLAGIALTLVAGRLVRSLLYGVSVSDPISLGTVVILLMSIALGAALQPALRASRADPCRALRAE